MEPTKKRAAMVRGINRLAPRIKELKTELKRLQDAEEWLIKEKWAAERELVTVQIIPIGVGAKQKAKDDANVAKRIANMDADEAAELLAMLEARLGKGE